MKADELRELLASVPDHYEVGVELVQGEDTSFIPIVGKSDSAWDFGFALLCGDGKERGRLL